MSSRTEIIWPGLEANRVLTRLVQSSIVAPTIEKSEIVQLSFKQLGGDGSSRFFIRVFYSGTPVCVAVFPPTQGDRDMDEFRSSVAIGSHLFRAGIRVPKILGYEARAGLILFEDLGDTRLHDLLSRDKKRALSYYEPVIQELVCMQVKGVKGLKPEWCYDTPCYDEQVMMERESGYFLNAFWKELLAKEIPPEIIEELRDIAATIMASSEPFFLHRDFQSRNIMLHKSQIRVIDFQAGRVGPPGYDLASLLIDPYADLSEFEQQHLFNFYLKEIDRYPEISREKVIQTFPFLALQRNLQIIGAFSFLSKQMGKRFFETYLSPSLVMLSNRLQEKCFAPYRSLRKMAEDGLSCFSATLK